METLDCKFPSWVKRRVEGYPPSSYIVRENPVCPCRSTSEVTDAPFNKRERLGMDGKSRD